MSDTVSALALYEKVPGLTILVETMKTSWTTMKSSVGSSRKVITEFLMNCLDGLITYLVNFDLSGKDKKTVVLHVMNDLYDYVVASTLPFWIRPFGRLIKDFVVNVLISYAIDWIVSKYKDGSWNKPSPEKVMNLWGVPGGHRPT